MIRIRFAGIEEAAEILVKPKSEVVREAVTDYRQRIGKLANCVRSAMARRRGGRRTRSE